MNLYKTNALIEAALQVLDTLDSEPAVSTQLLGYGHDEAKRAVGREYVATLRDHLADRADREQERWALSQQINTGLKAVREQLREHVRIARFALNDDPQRLHSLRVDPISLRTWECVDQAIFFYRKLTEQNIGLEKFGLPKKEVEQSQQAATELLTLKQQRIRQKGRAETTTQEIQLAVRNLRDWLVEFRGIARVAYRHQPQMLEMFGMPVRSSVKARPALGTPGAVTGPGGVSAGEVSINL